MAWSSAIEHREERDFNIEAMGAVQTARGLMTL
jgi:hypothetical protein